MNKLLYATIPAALSSFALGQSPAIEVPSAPLPLGGGWVHNHGQWSSGVQAAGEVGGLPMALVAGGIQWVLKGSGEDLSVRLRVLDSEGSEVRRAWELESPLPGLHSYFIGGVQAPGLPAYSAARLAVGRAELAVQLEEGAGWRVAAPNGDPVRFRLEGARAASVGPGGDLVLEYGSGLWRLPAPSVRGMPSGRWSVHGEDEVGLWPLEPALAMVASGDDSPSVDWGTYLGTLGFSNDEGRGADYDSEGRPITCGFVPASTFPTVVGPFLTTQGAADGFVTKFTADGSELVFSSYLGGSRKDYVVDVDLASNDEIALFALTRSPSFPLTPNAYDSVLEPTGQQYAGAVLKLSPDGQTILSSTLFGTRIGDSFPRKFVLAREDGSVVVAGDFAVDIPITPNSAFGPEQGSGFLAGLSGDGTQLLFSTSPPCAPFLTERSDGALVIGGDTGSSDPALPGAFQEAPAPGSGLNAWLGVVSADGSQVLASSYLSGNELDSGRGVAVDAQGHVYIAGTTGSADFPRGSGTLGAAPDPFTPGYVAKFDPLLQELLWSTTVGASQPGIASNPQTAFEAVVCDASGVTTAVGWGGGADPFATVGSHEPDLFTGQDGRIFRLSPDGQRVLYSSLLGVNEPTLSGIRPPVLAANGRTALLNGTVNGSADVTGDFPVTTGSFKDSCLASCGNEAYLLQFNFFHEGVSALGGGGQSCLGSISLNTTRRADPGADDFAFYASQAPPGTLGVLLLGQPLALPLAVEGQTLYVDLATLLPIQTLLVEESGFTALDLVIPPSAAGLSFAAQAVFAETATCGVLGQLVASEGIQVSIP